MSSPFRERFHSSECLRQNQPGTLQVFLCISCRYFLFISTRLVGYLEYVRPVKCSNPSTLTFPASHDVRLSLLHPRSGIPINCQWVLMLYLYLVVPSVSRSPHLLRIHGSLLTQEVLGTLDQSAARGLITCILLLHEAREALNFVPLHLSAVL